MVPLLHREADLRGAALAGLGEERAHEGAPDALAPLRLVDPEGQLGGGLVDETEAGMVGGQEERPHDPQRLLVAFGDDAEVPPQGIGPRVVRELRGPAHVVHGEALAAPVDVPQRRALEQVRLGGEQRSEDHGAHRAIVGARQRRWEGPGAAGAAVPG